MKVASEGVLARLDEQIKEREASGTDPKVLAFLKARRAELTKKPPLSDGPNASVQTRGRGDRSNNV